ncbi:MAG TPA: diaminopimelate decarboxylase [Myxococcota bacterium]|jgi:diaminopimelate decarboxylase|nr:diaminopimelate decarboxylase [Myxococcota bacterium]
MHLFEYRGAVLHAEDVPLTALAAAYGTPTYVYSAATLRRHFRVVDAAFAARPHLVCFSVKACSNVHVLALLAGQGAGFDVVSGGELARALRAGAPPARVVFSGVGKTAAEMAEALDAGILLFNVESEPELELLSAVAAARGRRAPVAVRFNPDVDAATHPYIATGLRDSKFGVTLDTARRMYARARALDGIEIAGIDCHIGSQITDVGPVRDAMARVVELAHELRAAGHAVRYVDVGGGIGIPYRDDPDDAPPAPADFGAAVHAALGALDVTLLCEPGRVIAGNAGVLLTRVLYVKQGDARRFLVVDAAMNDLVRPALYGAWHAIWPVARARPEAGLERVDVVGPVCESSDFLAKDRDLPACAAGDLLAVMSAGAYGFSMSSNYNSRPRAAEVLVDAGDARLVRRRETVDDLLAAELEL